jgi:hypothetical protein
MGRAIRAFGFGASAWNRTEDGDGIRLWDTQMLNMTCMSRMTMRPALAQKTKFDTSRSGSGFTPAQHGRLLPEDVQSPDEAHDTKRRPRPRIPIDFTYNACYLG